MEKGERSTIDRLAGVINDSTEGLAKGSKVCESNNMPACFHRGQAADFTPLPPLPDPPSHQVWFRRSDQAWLPGELKTAPEGTCTVQLEDSALGQVQAELSRWVRAGHASISLAGDRAGQGTLARV